MRLAFILLVLSCLAAFVTAAPVPGSGLSTQGVGSPHDGIRSKLRAKAKGVWNRLRPSKQQAGTIEVTFQADNKQPFKLRLRPTSTPHAHVAANADQYEVVARTYKGNIVLHFIDQSQFHAYTRFGPREMIAKDADDRYVLTSIKASNP